ncbi:MAG TPA: hypothetical protein PL066_03445 [bacterium]|nr:hypothetical protein [bacterium]
MSTSKNVDKKLAGRIFLVRNKVCNSPATYNWLLYKNEEDWSEEIREDLHKNFPLLEKPLIQRMQSELDVIIGMMVLLADEQSSHHAMAQEVLPRLLQVRELMDQVYQKIYLYHLSPEPSYVAAQFLERNWQKIIAEVRAVATLGPMPKEKDDPVAKAWMSLAKNTRILDRHLSKLLEK